MQTLEAIQSFDPVTGMWYEQAPTGTAQGALHERRSSSMYKIVIYAGWKGSLGDDVTPWDSLYVLSLSSFHWFQSNCVAINPGTVVCERAGGGRS